DGGQRTRQGGGAYRRAGAREQLCVERVLLEGQAGRSGGGADHLNLQDLHGVVPGQDGQRSVRGVDLGVLALQRRVLRRQRDPRRGEVGGQVARCDVRVRRLERGEVERERGVAGAGQERGRAVDQRGVGRHGRVEHQ